MNRTQILRLGLFQMAAGGLSVIFLGVLNRIMRVELGMDLLLVSFLIGGGHYMGAVVAIPFGHFSDTHSVAGYRRTIYIIMGTIVTITILILAPQMAAWVSYKTTILRITIAFIFFLLEGISTFLAGTAYLALIADLTKPNERGSAAALVWTLLMVGIIITGIGSASYMEIYSFDRIIILCSITSAIALLMTLIALWKQEDRTNDKISQPESLLKAVNTMISSQTARRFAAFLLLGMFSYFMQDVILEPFGGEVFGLSAAETTRFNSYMGIGLVSAMLFGGMYLTPRIGKRRVTTLGCWIIAISFTGLAISGFLENGQTLNPIIGLLGLGAGFFTVGSVALMMDMTATQHIGLFVGTWTLVQAVAKGPAAILSGGFQQMFSSLGLLPGQAYGSVFLLEAIGIVSAMIVLNGVTIENFREEMKSALVNDPISID